MKHKKYHTRINMNNNRDMSIIIPGIKCYHTTTRSQTAVKNLKVQISVNICINEKKNYKFPYSKIIKALYLNIL